MSKKAVEKLDSAGIPHRFKPGNEYGKNQPKRASLRADLREMLRQKYPPEKIWEMLEETYAAAARYNSSKSMLNVIQLILLYSEGRPAQTKIHELGENATNTFWEEFERRSREIDERAKSPQILEIEAESEEIA